VRFAKTNSLAEPSLQARVEHSRTVKHNLGAFLVINVGHLHPRSFRHVSLFLGSRAVSYNLSALSAGRTYRRQLA
jgi:hypothetical protein